MNKQQALDRKSLAVEPVGESQGQCDCCGTTTKRVWGWVHHDDTTLAAYFVGWTEGMPDHGVTFDLALGRWGEGSGPNDRQSVALDYRHDANAFMVVDASGRTADRPEIASIPLSRADVIGTPLAQQVFAISDAVYEACGVATLCTHSST